MNAFTRDATSPTCFSELAGLMQCYDDIKAMEAILSRVMADLVEKNPAVLKAILDAIRKSGMGDVPIIGATDGKPAEPGQVGEWLPFTATGTITGAIGQIQAVTAGILPPGDFDLFAWLAVTGDAGSANIALNPLPPGLADNMQTFGPMGAAPAGVPLTMVMPTVQALTSGPVPLNFQLTTNQTSAVVAGGTFTLNVRARRAR